MNDKKEFTIKEFNGKIKDKNKKEKFDITELKTKDKKLEVGENKAETVKVMVKISNDDGKTWADPVEKDVIIEYKPGFFTHGGIVKKIDNEEVEEKGVSLAGNSFNWKFYTGISVLALLIVAGIWWWIASSKSEDKEEESL